MNSSVSQTERASILEALLSADEEVRRLAVEQLLVLPISEAARQLYECLGDEAWRVRKAAVERLVACGGQPPVQEMLVSSLADGENPGRRNSAFEALVGCGARATARLVTELSSEDVDVRKLVIDALAAIGDPTARGPLVSAIEDPDPNVRAAAVEALGVLGGSQEIECLIDAAANASEVVLVRLSALRALSQMAAGVGLSRLGDSLDDAQLRPAAFELLGHSGDPAAVPALLKGLSCRAKSSRESAMAALLRTIGRLDDLDADDLIGALRESAQSSDTLIEASCERLEVADLASRMVLVQFLGLLEDARVVVPILLAGRDDAIEELADATLESLGKYVPLALDAAWNDLAGDVKARACTLLGRVGGEMAERLLVDALASADSELRCRAASALGDGGFIDRVLDLVRRLEAAAQSNDLESEDEVAALIAAIIQLAERPEASEAGIDVQLIEFLSSRLGGTSEPVRMAIAQVFSRIGRTQDQDVIVYLLKDESPAVRRAAVGALGRFDFEQAVASLRISLADESSRVRIAAAKVLGASGRIEAADEIRRLISDQDPWVVAVSVRCIGQLYKETASPPDEISTLLRDALAGNPIVALAGLDALRDVGDPETGRLALSALTRSEPDVVRSAVACIGAFGSADDLVELVALVPHADWSVRAEVADVLSERRCRKCLPSLLRRLEIEDDAFVRQVILRSIGRLER